MFFVKLQNLDKIIRLSKKKLNAQSISSLAFSKAAKHQTEMQKRQETFDETVKIPGSALTRSSGRYNESEPVSMFGKFISAPLGKKPLPSINATTANSVNRHFDGAGQPSMSEPQAVANGGAPFKLHENKQATVSHLQPQLDLNLTGERQPSMSLPSPLIGIVSVSSSILLFTKVFFFC